MAETTAVRPAGKREIGRLKRWLLKGRLEEMEGPHEREGQLHQHPRWMVMCLTGVDYFSTLGYQPGIAIVAAGALSPIATLVLVLLPLFQHRIAVTLFLIAALGAVFLKGFKEAIGIAVLLVAVYITLNLIVVIVGFYQIATH